MKVNKVRKYQPGYPKKKDTLNNPNLLKSMPGRWKNLLVSGSVLSSVVLTSCGVSSPQDLLNKLIPTPTPPRGFFGGMIVIQEYYFTDEEAVDIIVEEFANCGIAFDTVNTDKVVAELPVDVKFDMRNDKFDYYTLPSGFYVDGVNKRYNISFEYVSSEDFSKWTTDENMNSEHIKGKFLDEFLEDGIFETKNGELVMAFYNSSHHDPAWLEEELRQQVREFIQMLHEQGVL